MVELQNAIERFSESAWSNVLVRATPMECIKSTKTSNPDKYRDQLAWYRLQTAPKEQADAQ
jgi:hypothetical protein